MIFKNLKEKCNYYRDLTDFKLLPNNYTLVMIDGKNFSKLIKNKFEKPFDDWFISTMDKTAIHLCKEIQNCVGAFVQSDEISLVIKDNSMTSAPFDGRLCKLLSIIPSIATSFFNKEIIKRNIKTGMDIEDVIYSIDNMPDYCFDCKAWVVPSTNDAMAWILYRQIDCIRNSKQQFAQTYLTHKELMNKDTDMQVELCLEKTGHDWNAIENYKKYGRLFYKVEVNKTRPDGIEYVRHEWTAKSEQLTNDDVRIEFTNYLENCLNKK
jgi:tRNA(His) 5'-end guanylyltransferase